MSPVLVNPYRFGAVGGSSYDSVLTALSPAGRWKLNDTSGTTAVAAVGSNGSYVSVIGSVTLGDPGLVTDGGTAATVAAAGSQDVTIPLGTRGTSGWLAFWMKGTQSGANIFPWRDNTSSGGWLLNFTGANIIVRINGTDHTTSTATSTVTDGVRHFWVLQTNGTTVTLFIDGTQVDSWAKTANFSTLATPLHFGRNGPGSGAYVNATFDDIATGSGTLTGTNVSDLWTSGTA